VQWAKALLKKKPKSQPKSDERETDNQ
jgi:hypothetical protein